MSQKPRDMGQKFVSGSQKRAKS